MISRRSLLVSAAATAATATFFRDNVRLAASASQPSTPVNFAVPPGAIDCHAHIFADPKLFPLSPGRGFTPELASLDEQIAMHKAVHVDRVVLVNSSIYGTDPAVTVDGLGKLGKAARGVVTIDEAIPDAQLDALHKAGVRGVRQSLLMAGQTTPADAKQHLQTLAKKLDGRGWSIEVSGVPLAMTDALFDDYMTVPMPIVFAHFAGAQAAAGVEQPGFQSLLKLMKAGKAYVKLSAVYNSSKMAPDYADVGPLALALAGANPDRAIYGSDWPHPVGRPPAGGTKFDTTPLLAIDDGRVLNQFAVWFPDAGLRKKIFVDNPARLYGF
jgi:predicted TIM-barrel fold metal-dependent hydrolase